MNKTIGMNVVLLPLGKIPPYYIQVVPINCYGWLWYNFSMRLKAYENKSSSKIDLKSTNLIKMVREWFRYSWTRKGYMLAQDITYLQILWKGSIMRNCMAKTPLQWMECPWCLSEGRKEGPPAVAISYLLSLW